MCTGIYIQTLMYMNINQQPISRQLSSLEREGPRKMIFVIAGTSYF